MAAWVLGLSLGAGYLFNKKLLNTTSLLEEAEKQYQGVKKPSSNGITTSEIRGVRADTRFAHFGDFSEEVPHPEKLDLVKEQQRMQQQAREFDLREAEPAPLKGVWLSSERDFC